MRRCESVLLFLHGYTTPPPTETRGIQLFPSIAPSSKNSPDHPPSAEVRFLSPSPLSPSFLLSNAGFSALGKKLIMTVNLPTFELGFLKDFCREFLAEENLTKIKLD